MEVLCAESKSCLNNEGKWFFLCFFICCLQTSTLSSEVRWEGWSSGSYHLERVRIQSGRIDGTVAMTIKQFMLNLAIYIVGRVLFVSFNKSL